LEQEEQDCAFRVIAELRRLNDEIRVERAGRPFTPPARQLINEARDERTRRLG